MKFSRINIFKPLMLILFMGSNAGRAVDYSSREVIRSLSPEAYKHLVPPHYDKYGPPATDDQPAIVYFDMKLLDITSVNENDMTFSVESFVTYRWKDWRLRWPLENITGAPCWNPPPKENLTGPLQYTQICSGTYTPEIQRCVDTYPPQSKRLILDIKVLENIWQPDAFFKNGIRSTIHKDWVANEYLAFYTNDAHVRLFSRMAATLICKFNFTFYPFDHQECHMTIGSMSYRSDLVQFEWCESWAPAGSKLDVNIFSLPHFSLEKYEHIVCNAEYPCVKAVFLLRRHPDFHILHTYVPTVLIVILSWMSFWISPDATPARVTLGVTSILTMATQYSQSTKNLPPVSYIKSLDIWMITCMVYVFAALLEFAIVYHVHNTLRTTGQNSLTPDSNASTQNGGGTVIERMDSIEDEVNVCLRWLGAWRLFCRKATAIDEASRVIFPITYLTFIIGYFALVTGTPEQGSLSTHIPN